MANCTCSSVGSFDRTDIGTVTPKRAAMTLLNRASVIESMPREPRESQLEKVLMDGKNWRRNLRRQEEKSGFCKNGK
jgi:hypothetical protein